MSEAISHRGIITNVSPKSITVSIDKKSEECGKCAIASVCSRDTEIAVPYHSSDPSIIGKTVEIATTSTTHKLAILLYIAMPLLMMINVLAIGSIISDNQLIIGVSALAAIFIWYSLIYAFRNRLKGKTKFHVVRIF